MLLELFLGLLGVSILLWYKNYYTRTSGARKMFKGPFPWPFVGNMDVFKEPQYIFDTLIELMEKYGKNVITIVLWDITLFTLDADFIEFIVTNTKSIKKGVVYRFIKNWLAEGLLTSSGAKWQKRRKLITPAYHFSILENFVEVFERNGTTMIQKLQKHVNKEEFNIYPYVNLCALDIICETAMGTKVNAQENENSSYVKHVKDMTRIALTRGFSLFKYFDSTYVYTKDYQIEKTALNELHKYTMDVIKIRREELLLQKNDKKSDEKDVNPKRREAFLDILLKSSVDGNPLTDEEIREEVDTFMFEGHDTVSSAISFCLYALSQNPEVQQKVYEEQTEIFGRTSQRTTTTNDIQEMKYLDLVIKESLRLYPSVPIFTREIQEDLQYRDITFKKGTQIVICPYLLHRRPEIFPDPLKFDPDRFLPENQFGRHPFSYIPFSAGFRNCIGQRFALYEMKTSLGKILRNFEILPADTDRDLKIKSEVVLSSENGIIVKLKSRS